MRFKKTLLNYVGTLLPSLLVMVLSFVRTSVFASELGLGAGGVDALFGTVSGFIHLAEAGLGTAVITTLYRLVAANDHTKINQIMTGARYQMRRVGVLILFMGIAVGIFAPILVNENPFSFGYTYLIWGIYLLRSLIGYFYYSPGPIVRAHQNDYKMQVINMPIQVITVIVEIILMLNGADLVILTIAGMIVSVIQIALSRWYIKKLYPWFQWTSKDQMDLSTKDKTKDLFVHKLSQLVLTSTDTLMMSVFVSASAAGIFNLGYRKVFDAVTRYLQQILFAADSSLGNLYASETKEKKLQVLNEQMDITFFLGAVVIIPMYLLAQPFIFILIKETFDHLFLTVMIILTYYQVTRVAVGTAIDLHAMFKETKMAAIIEAIVNLVLSLILVQFLGVTGVLIGTLISLVVTNFWFYPYILYKQVFDMKPWRYFMKYFSLFGITVVAALIWQFILMPVFITPWNSLNTLGSWFIGATIITAINGVAFLVLFWFGSQGFRTFIGRFLNLAKEAKNRVKS
ncbi:polysaccharide biosynthesis C-terminal domain-containing protein [Culicoidibacter larvae]|uniref:Polysaccharide biosynthesis protein C-terminal domain-containing protein n=1 Tax=Culicoidibacter larvae TaxID=2579976 RepID=A0A5R8QIA0_9FIRM|nr:polysaccharide biosynthesis C-terminal domain-containing protein [Culicoidibacter larvae]TLG77446.1 hypothetical protein FEZ08_02160 [Culicoidibacter larvae]